MTNQTPAGADQDGSTDPARGPGPGAEGPAKGKAKAQLAPGETVLYARCPSMIGTHPFLYILCMLVCAAGVVLAIAFSVWLLLATALGLFILLVWWITTKTVKLIVTDRRTVLRRGLLSRWIDEVQHEHVRNIQIYQSFLQRLLNVGKIGISSAAQSDVEIEVEGLRDPDRVRQIINGHK